MASLGGAYVLFRQLLLQFISWCAMGKINVVYDCVYPDLWLLCFSLESPIIL